MRHRAKKSPTRVEVGEAGNVLFCNEFDPEIGLPGSKNGLLAAPKLHGHNARKWVDPIPASTTSDLVSDMMTVIANIKSPFAAKRIASS